MNAFVAISLMWFWFKYKNRNAGKPLKASAWSVVTWFSFKKIEWSWVRPLNEFDGTSLMWLNRKSLKQKWKSFCLLYVKRIFKFQSHDFKCMFVKLYSTSGCLISMNIILCFMLLFITSPQRHNFYLRLSFSRSSLFKQKGIFLYSFVWSFRVEMQTKSSCQIDKNQK